MDMNKLPAYLSVAASSVAGSVLVFSANAAGHGGNGLPYIISNMGIGNQGLVSYGIFHALSFLVFSLAAGIMVTGFQKTSAGGVFSSVMTLSSLPVFTSQSSNPSALLFSGLAAFAMLFALKGAGDVRVEAKSAFGRRASSNPLLNPQSGRSAVRGRTRLGAPLFSANLAAALILTMLSAVAAPQGVFLSSALAIFILSYGGSLMKKLLRSAIFMAVSTLPAWASAIFMIVAGIPGDWAFRQFSPDYSFAWEFGTRLTGFLSSGLPFTVFRMDYVNTSVTWAFLASLILASLFAVTGVVTSALSRERYSYSPVFASGSRRRPVGMASFATVIALYMLSNIVLGNGMSQILKSATTISPLTGSGYMSILLAICAASLLMDMSYRTVLENRRIPVMSGGRRSLSLGKSALFTVITILLVLPRALALWL